MPIFPQNCRGIAATMTFRNLFSKQRILWRTDHEDVFLLLNWLQAVYWQTLMLGNSPCCLQCLPLGQSASEWQRPATAVARARVRRALNCMMKGFCVFGCLSGVYYFLFSDGDVAIKGEKGTVVVFIYPSLLSQSGICQASLQASIIIIHQYYLSNLLRQRQDCQGRGPS